ncbi:hypothetical protein BT69DRAFT_979375 [Atractiella rhizophila]|nr:hypothetical protein BT69DRAFT_979375 [Atractiella rhizophila]
MPSSIPSSAIAGCLQLARDIYSVRSRWKDNKRLSDALIKFAQNLEAALFRLKAREGRLTGAKSNVALDSISREFENVRNLLQSNEENLKSAWNANEAANWLQALDDRAFKSFASKFSVALFESVQGNRRQHHDIQKWLDTHVITTTSRDHIPSPGGARGVEKST